MINFARGLLHQGCTVPTVRSKKMWFLISLTEILQEQTYRNESDRAVRGAQVLIGNKLFCL